MREMEGGRYDHSQEGEMYDTQNINASTEIVKMRRKLIVDLISEGQITNPEAAIIIVEKLQRERNKREKELHEEASQQTGTEIYGTARKYAETSAAYAKYLIGEPPSPVRYCIEEAQKRIKEGFLRSGYDIIQAEDSYWINNSSFKGEPRKYSARACDIAAWNYRAAANWYTMAAELARRQEETPEVSPPPEEDH